MLCLFFLVVGDVVAFVCFCLWFVFAVVSFCVLLNVFFFRGSAPHGMVAIVFVLVIVMCVHVLLMFVCFCCVGVFVCVFCWDVVCLFVFVVLLFPLFSVFFLRGTAPHKRMAIACMLFFVLCVCLLGFALCCCLLCVVAMC